MKATSLRTQIILPKTLRDEIEKQRRITGESLAEYLRKAAEERLAREKKKKTDLKKLADEVISSSKGLRTDAEIDALLQQIRIDREEDDAHRMKRLNEALGYSSPPVTQGSGAISLGDANLKKKKK